MTYTGPERRTLPSDFHDKLADLLREVTSAEVSKALAPIGTEVTRLRRVIEGENGGSLFSIGVVGAVEKVTATVSTHDHRLVELERKWDRMRWTVGGAALGGGIGGGGIVAWVVHLLQGSV